MPKQCERGPTAGPRSQRRCGSVESDRGLAKSRISRVHETGAGPVQEAMFHCGKSMVRSHMWEPDLWGAVDGLPTYCRVLVDHAQFDRSVEDMERATDLNEKNRLYDEWRSRCLRGTPSVVPPERRPSRGSFSRGIGRVLTSSPAFSRRRSDRGLFAQDDGLVPRLERERGRRVTTHADLPRRARSCRSARGSGRDPRACKVRRSYALSSSCGPTFK